MADCTVGRDASEADIKKAYRVSSFFGVRLKEIDNVETVEEVSSRSQPG